MKNEREVGIYKKRGSGRAANCRFDVEIDGRIQEYDCVGTLPLVMEEVSGHWQIAMAADEWYTTVPGKDPGRSAVAAAAEIEARQWWKTTGKEIGASSGPPIINIQDLGEATAMLARIDDALNVVNDATVRAIDCEVIAQGTVHAATGRTQEIAGGRNIVQELIKEFIGWRHADLVRWMNEKRETVADEVVGAYRCLEPALEAWRETNESDWSGPLR